MVKCTPCNAITDRDLGDGVRVEVKRGQKLSLGIGRAWGLGTGVGVGGWRVWTLWG
jgi:hypothetical protein